MDWFDIIVFLVLIFALVKGYMSGFVMQVAWLAAFIFAGIFAGQVAGIILPYIQNIHSSAYIRPITFIISFILIMIIIILIGSIIHSFIKAIKLNSINKLAGSFLSSIKYLFLISLLVNLILQFDKNEFIFTPEIKEKSVTLKYVEKIAPVVIPYLKEVQQQIKE